MRRNCCPPVTPPPCLLVILSHSAVKLYSFSFIFNWIWCTWELFTIDSSFIKFKNDNLFSIAQILSSGNFPEGLNGNTMFENVYAWVSFKIVIFFFSVYDAHVFLWIKWVMPCMWRSEDSLQRLIISFYCIGFRNEWGWHTWQQASLLSSTQLRRFTEHCGWV